MVKDLNYFPLDVESNIYGMTKLEFDNRTNKVLVATLDCRIYCINYNRFKPQTKEVEFTYIPNGAKIISIGALKRGPNDFVIGITHSLSPTVPKSATSREIAGDAYNSRQTTYYFNIYASEAVSPSFDLDYVAQGCQTIRLRYVPYHLYSTELLSYQQDAASSTDTIKRKPIWLLSGGDNHIHSFIEDRPYQSFNEIPIEDCFPELCDKHQSIALWIDVANIVRSVPNSTNRQFTVERAVALGFEDGSVKLFCSVLEKEANKYVIVGTSNFDTYTTIIPCVKLFKINSTNNKSPLRRLLGDRNLICDIDNQDNHLNKLNLLVVSSTDASIVFRDVLRNGLDQKQVLASSQRLDCVTSATIDDTNVDGCNEILLASHGRELITYQYNRSQDSYELNAVNLLNYPIFAMTILDLTGDGLQDLIVLLASGILIMKSPTKDAIDTCRRRIKAVLAALR